MTVVVSSSKSNGNEMSEFANQQNEQDNVNTSMTVILYENLSKRKIKLIRDIRVFRLNP